ncbi:MAG: sigma 54-interacting transcriptional regulator [Deltaproteobacteria bacterium]|nr:sigma 54-interacting transcriptional regulator [Deltaproteobacteria bacterium]
MRISFGSLGNTAPESRVLEIRHSVLEGDGGSPLAKARLTDRQRLGIVMQATALLAVLEECGWRLSQGWRAARVSTHGQLRLSPVEAGRSSTLPQALLRQLLLELFGGGKGISGRGQGRAAAKRLLEVWKMDLAPVSARQATAQVFAEAPFLWEPSFADVRRCLVAALQRTDGWYLWGAGEGSFLHRLEHRIGVSKSVLEAPDHPRDPSRVLAAYSAAQAVVAGDAARALWCPAKARTPLAASASLSLKQAQEAYDAGRFESALAGAARFRSVEASLLKARCQQFLGKLKLARATVSRLETRSLELPDLLATADVALRVLGNLRDREGQSRWLERILNVGEEAGGVANLKVQILAANVAWDQGDLEGIENHLTRSQEAADHPALGWRWHQARGMQAMSAGDGKKVVEHLRIALKEHRRSLRRFEAAGLWNDLGWGRAQLGDLVGAERAYGHCHRLYRGSEGPRQATLGLYNLAEIRLRRGRLVGVREALELSTVTNRRDGNVRGSLQDDELWARYELTLGRPRAALDHALGVLDRQQEPGEEWNTKPLRALAARALGWMGRSGEAARQLSRTTETALSSVFEPEELPAVWALAGLRERALAAAAGTAQHQLWEMLLIGREAPDAAWQSLEELEPYRAARLVFDFEAVASGAVPVRWRRHAIEVFYRVGARALGERLEARDGGAWSALASYAKKDSVELEAIATLFSETGYSQAQLWWLEEPMSSGRLLFGGSGGSEKASLRVEGGSLELRAAIIDRPLTALLHLAARDLEIPRLGNDLSGEGVGILGESPEIIKALERAKKLAASDVPVLVLGESGTGKELFARQLHDGSSRKDGPFVPLNCAALSEQLILSDLFGHLRGAFTGADRDRAGIFETARGGTVFLDEIGDLPLTAQGMLLRVLQEGEVRRLGESLPRRVDVRIVTATHRDLSQMVRDRHFREDLFYRLKVGYLNLPPLRDRGRDVVLLAEHFARRCQPPVSLSRQARARLLSYGWSGNVRELENVIRAAAAMVEGRKVESDDLEFARDTESPVTDYHQSLEAFRRRLLENALASSKNQSEAARRLGLTRQALSYLIRQLNLS